MQFSQKSSLKRDRLELSISVYCTSVRKVCRFSKRRESNRFRNISPLSLLIAWSIDIVLQAMFNGNTVCANDKRVPTLTRHQMQQYLPLRLLVHLYFRIEFPTWLFFITFIILSHVYARISWLRTNIFASLCSYRHRLTPEGRNSKIFRRKFW